MCLFLDCGGVGGLNHGLEGWCGVMSVRIFGKFQVEDVFIDILSI